MLGDSSALTNAKELHRVQKHLNFDEPINIQYTSGTTGLAKVIVYLCI